MKKLITFILTLSIIASGYSDVYAAVSSVSQIEPQNTEFKERIGISYDYIQGKLKLTDADLKKIKSTRHGLEEYLIGKGWKKEDIWALKKGAKFAAIDEKVKKGELTKEEGEQIKIKIENRKMKHKQR